MYAKAYPYTKPKGGWVDGNPFAIPKNQRNGPIVRVVGIPYHGTSYDMERFTSIEKGDEDILICVAHVLASHKGGTMFEGEDIIKYADLVDTAPDVFMFGHWHKNQGVEEIGGKQFVNIGSLTRGSLSQDNLDRVPAAAVLRCTEKGVEIEVKPLNVRPAVEVFDVEGRERQVKRQVEMDSFVTAIRDALQPAKEGETLAEAVTGMGDVPNEIRERALDSTSLGVSHQARNRELADMEGFIEPHLWTGVGRARSGCGAALVGSADQILSELEAYRKMGIRAFIFSGYPHIEECAHFGKLVMPHLNGCSLPDIYGRVPASTPATPLAAGERR